MVNYVQNITLALRALAPTYIAWPSAEERTVLQDYYKRHFFGDKVVGAVDGSCIPCLVVLSVAMRWRLLRQVSLREFVCRYNVSYCTRFSPALSSTDTVWLESNTVSKVELRLAKSKGCYTKQ